MGEACSRRREEGSASQPETEPSPYKQSASALDEPDASKATPGKRLASTTAENTPKVRKKAQAEEEDDCQLVSAIAAPSATAKEGHQGRSAAAGEDKQDAAFAESARAAAQAVLLKKARAQEARKAAAQSASQAAAQSASQAKEQPVPEHISTPGRWGKMTAEFDGRSYGPGYLTVKAGEDVFMETGDDAGWGTAQVRRGAALEKGHIPSNFWQATGEKQHHHAQTSGATAAATSVSAPASSQAGKWGKMTFQFDATQYGEGYLTVDAGEDVFMHPSDESGWALGQMQRDGTWHQGWLPTGFWQANQ